MATITRRGSTYAVVYRYTDDNGKKKQKWESFSTRKAAEKRKTEIEYGQSTNSFITPAKDTLEEFLQDWVNTYGVRKWSVSTYGNTVSLLDNYVIPFLGQLKVQDIDARVIDQYIHALQTAPPVSTRTKKAKTEYITSKTIARIIKTLCCAFNQAVRYELVAKNPFTTAILPRSTTTKRAIWTADIIRQALDACDNPQLSISIHISFACSCRLAEILGLTWANVHITDEDIATDNARIDVVQELERVNRAAMDAIGQDDIYFIFPTIQPGTTTRLVLKKPKTDSSIRTIWLPKTLAFILKNWKQQQEKMKDFLGTEYQDYDLVVALDNGRPCENRIIEKYFSTLKEKAGLPNVVFHSLRHSSTTYKLKLNHGDLKATQGDTGHAQLDMITDVYSHILDEDRKVNATKFDNAFYTVPKISEMKTKEESINAAKLVEQLTAHPELLEVIANMLAKTNESANRTT